MISSTVITALFDINRANHGDGRTIDQYLLWFKDTLSLNCPFVIFTESRFIDFIRQFRSDNNTIIIEQKLEDIPYYQYKQQINNIIHSYSYKTKIKDPNRIECKLDLYNIIQYSKFEWLLLASQLIKSDFYFWMDAGCSRFFQNVDTKNIWPCNYSILDQQKFNIQGNINTINYKINDIENYIWDNNSILVGTLFGCSSTICNKISHLMKQEFEKYLSLNIVNNEQILLGYLYHKCPDLFNVFIKLDGQHLPIFKELSL